MWWRKWKSITFTLILVKSIPISKKKISFILLDNWQSMFSYLVASSRISQYHIELLHYLSKFLHIANNENQGKFKLIKILESEYFI